MFPREVRFYLEVAPSLKVRVPHCFQAHEERGATFLELEDLSWGEGAEPPLIQGLLSFCSADEGSQDAAAWLPRLEAAALRT